MDELSKQSGLSIGQLRKWESGNSLDCPATDMYFIAKALNVDIVYVMHQQPISCISAMEILRMFKETQDIKAQIY